MHYRIVAGEHVAVVAACTVGDGNHLIAGGSREPVMGMDHAHTLKVSCAARRWPRMPR